MTDMSAVTQHHADRIFTGIQTSHTDDAPIIAAAAAEGLWRVTDLLPRWTFTTRRNAA